jgi:hypothetical protein
MPDLLLENLHEDLEYCLRRVSFVLPSHFCAVVLVLIDFLFPRCFHCPLSCVRKGSLSRFWW